MGAWNKLFSDRTIVKSKVSVKRPTGVVESATLLTGAAGLSDADFADAARHGVKTLSESLKETLEDGSVKQKTRSISGNDITLAKGHGAVCDLLGMPDTVPEKVKERGRSVVPSANNGAAADGAVKS